MIDVFDLLKQAKHFGETNTDNNNWHIWSETPLLSFRRMSHYFKNQLHVSPQFLEYEIM